MNPLEFFLVFAVSQWFYLPFYATMFIETAVLVNRGKEWQK
jgi:hypothetical protein